MGDTSLGFQADVAGDDADDLFLDSVGLGEAASDGDKSRSRSPRRRGSSKTRKREKHPKSKREATPKKDKSPAKRKRRGAKEENLDEWKKCNSCTKWKLRKEAFNADQKKCKDCFNHIRSLHRVAASQKCGTDMKKLEEEDPKQYNALMKEFVKIREQSRKAGDKLKFSIQAFRVSWKSREGERKENVGEMMWEEEYYQWAKTAKAGFLSRQEAESNWNTWLNDKDWPRDTAGPRGYIRLYVRTADKIIGFEEVSKEKEFTKEEKLGKNASKEVIESRLGFVMGDQGLHAHEVCDFEDMRHKAQTAFASSHDQRSDNSAVANPFLDGILAPDVDDLLQAVEKKKRKSGAKAEEKNESSDASGEEEEENDDENKKDPKDDPKRSWFDQETQTIKAERAFKLQMEKVRAEMVKVSESMSDTLTKFRSQKSESQDGAREFKTEMHVVERRQDWLNATLMKDGGQEKLTGLIQALSVAESGADSATESRDMSAIARAGPCAGYEQLKPVAYLEGFASSFRSCTSKQQIKSKVEELAPVRKVLTSLTNSCKSALADLNRAKKKRDEDKEKEKNKKVKDAAEEKAKAKAKTQRRGSGVTKHLLINPDSGWASAHIPSDTKWKFEWSYSEPFVISSGFQSFWDSNQKVEESLKQFGALFSESSMRITEGRAHKPLDPELVPAVHKHFEKILPPSFLLSPQESSEASHYQDVLKMLDTSSFGVASSHISLGKFELNQFPCVRVNWSGTRLVSVVLLQGVLQEIQTDGSQKKSLLDVLEWLAKAQEGDLMTLAKRDQAFMGTVGPNDVLYLPPGALVSHRVHQGSDLLGLRTGVLEVSMRNSLERILLHAPSNKAIQQSLELLKEQKPALMEELQQKHPEEPLLRFAAANALAKEKAEALTQSPESQESEKKKRENEEKERKAEEERQRMIKEQKEQELLEKEKQAKEKKEQERKDKEAEEQEKERQRLEQEKNDAAEKKRLEAEQKAKEELERKEKEEKERKEREEEEERQRAIKEQQRVAEEEKQRKIKEQQEQEQREREKKAKEQKLKEDKEKETKEKPKVVEDDQKKNSAKEKQKAEKKRKR
ncbi:unnamed protein product [Durusdinium trenchii]|uniref:Reticulocyte-binding protein 2-like a n=1 Tax=Durusdinium trenchii TaxID=1381693 RepID=A0ABP0LQ21_9DINO